MAGIGNLKKIHYKITVIDDYDENDDIVLTQGTVDVKKALKDHSLVWINKDENCTRKFFYHGKVNEDVYFKFSFEALAHYNCEIDKEEEVTHYSNDINGNVFEEEALVEEHTHGSVVIKEQYYAQCDITIE